MLYIWRRVAGNLRNTYGGEFSTFRWLASKQEGCLLVKKK
jgi:hypothetical protein